MAQHFLASSDRLPRRAGECVRWDHVSGTGIGLAVAEIVRMHPGLVLIVTASVAQAEALETQLRFFHGSDARLAVLPDLEVLPYDHFSPHQDLVSARLRILRDLDLGRLRVLITAVPTLLPRLPPRDYLRSHALHLGRGDSMSLETCHERLDLAGYRRVGQVSAHGEYAVRGSLLDFFPMGRDTPVRLDFLDDTVDSIRLFDPETQISSGTIDSLDTLPAREFPTDPEAIKLFRQQYRRRFEGNPVRSVIYREVSERRFPGGAENYLPLFFSSTSTLWEYIPAETLVITTGDPDHALDRAWQQIEERYAQLGSDLERPLLRPEEVFSNALDFRAQLAERPVLSLDAAAILPSSGRIAETSAIPGAGPLVSPRDAEPGQRLADFLHSTPDRLLLAVESAGRRELLHELLIQYGETPDLVESWGQFLNSARRIALAAVPLDRGLSLPAAGIAILSEQELFGQPPRRSSRKRRVRDPESIIGDLTDLRIGAPVVHLDHGVGRYTGLTRFDIGGTQTEFLTLEYAGGDRLHVPVSSLHLISRYTGASPEQAPLHRLGTDQWQKAKRRAAERIRDVAAELLDLYSQRAARPGRSAKPDYHDYEAFAAAFPFALTDDQARAIDEVLADLADAKPMDRLVCGDVGFGKTEVALRAAFAVVTSGRQVAVLVPTTLLAQQHFETFSDRFADWPVQLEVMSRFRSAAEHRQIIQRLAAGQVDIVIGTHRLLQKDIRFKDLGLIIVDEEHRFGVTHKERLKALRTEVDILTLTATPIPRTLNMALGGLREMSLITTPPESRLAIRTFLTTWSAQVIREACLRELQRGGQVYFVHNRIENIESVAEEVARIVPEARLEVAHGQMHERELERVMLDFYHRRSQILLCTAIIESGLDVPSANTIIIDRADQFGLAQLHQLRGRVGRSHHQAFAYLLAPPREALSGDAVKRLEALEALEDLGAGFVLATHDLEIRGAGELLGEEQSGQIQEIGFTLYNEMLSRAVKALRDGTDPDLQAAADRAPDVDLHVPALLPEEYLPDIHARLVLYKRIASSTSHDAVEELAAELRDRLGPLPEPTVNLLRLTGLRLQARAAGITRVQASAAGGSIEFLPGTRIDPARIVQVIESDPKCFRLDPRQRLLFRLELSDSRQRLEFCEQLIESLLGKTTTVKLRAPAKRGMA